MQASAFLQKQNGRMADPSGFNFRQRASPDTKPMLKLQSLRSGHQSPESQITPTPSRLRNTQMTTTGNSFFRQSVTIESPSRISATKKICSPAIAGGYAMNSPQNDHTENAFNREGNRLAGFGPGMASALIGNANRKGQSLTVSDVKDTRKALATIGWGVQKPNLDQGVWRRLLPEMPHKKAFDFDGLKYLPHMDTTGKFAQHLDNQLGLPYDLLDDLSVREQRVIIKRRITELREIENFKIRSQTKSPTKPIDTTTNTRLYLKQLDRRTNASPLNQLANSTMQTTTQFERRSRSNLPYQKKPPTRSDISEMFGDVTTAATASPTLRNHALSIGTSEQNMASHLQEVSEVPYPKKAITNEYRLTRLLQKGCPKLLRHVEKHGKEIEKSLFETNRLSTRFHHNNRDRIKMSIMTTRSNAMQTPNLANTFDERGALSGFQTTTNAHLKHSLNKTSKNNASGPPSFPSMQNERSHGNSSELKQIEKTELRSKAHVPKLLLTQAMQFQKDQSVRNAQAVNLNSVDAAGDGINKSLMINSPESMFISQENPVMKQTFDTTRVNQTADRILESQEEVPVKESLQAMPDSPNKKINPIGAEDSARSEFAIARDQEEEQVVQDTEEAAQEAEEEPTNEEKNEINNTETA